MDQARFFGQQERFSCRTRAIGYHVFSAICALSVGVRQGFIFLYRIPLINLFRIISLLIAIGCMCLGTTGRVVSLLITGIAWAIIISIIIWILSTSSEEGPYHDPWILRKPLTCTSKADLNGKPEDV